MKFKKLLLISIIVLIAAFLRFYQLGSNPASLTWDEASWGYNAYSLGIDGKDEFGRFLPVNYLESFGDFKPPMYAYLDILPVKLFGLNEFTTRFPSAFFGVLTVLITYFLTKQIFYKSKDKDIYGYVSALILAFSPWHIMLSRAAFEANVATFFIVLGVWLFLKAVNEKSWFFVASIMSFVLSVYTFNTSRIVSPILVIIFSLIFKDKVLKNKKQSLTAFLVGFVLILPIFNFLLSPQARLRFNEVNIFTDSSVVTTANQEVINDNSFLSKIIHNRRVGYSLLFLKHYFDNLNPSFLFIKGDGNPKFSTQDVGQMYLFDLPFFLLGFFFLFKYKDSHWYVIPLWLLLAIIPAATARETPHALRIETTLPTFQIVIAYGLVQVVSRIKNKAFLSLLVMIFFLNVLYFLHGYYVHYPIEYSSEWQYGYKDSVNYVKDNENKYQKVNITDALGRPYIYYLFYTKTNPSEFRKSAVINRDPFGFVHVDSFGKYFFGKSNTPTLDKKEKVLYIDTLDRDYSGKNILKKFYLLNNNVALVAYTL